MNIGDIKTQVLVMADRIYEMIELVDKGFMENKTEILAAAMKKENELNDMEKKLTAQVLELSKSLKSEQERKDLIALEQAIEMLERMGDEAAGLVERIEIKIAEKLLFSDTGVAQFNETYGTMKKSVDMMRQFLKGKDGTQKDRIIDNGFQVKALVERYRAEHTDRLIKGLCTPMAANIYFDMRDFTGNLARHSSNIVKLF